MKDALVSIAMCTYNGKQFLDQQIQSILDQTYKNLELVIVDDCSSDGTFDLLKTWQDKYPGRFKIYQNETNLGYNKNFEKAISLCEGDFIAISDQDDIWLPEKIEKQIDAFTSDEVILTHCASVHFFGERDIHYKSGSLKWEHHFKGNDTRKLFVFNQVQGHNTVFRKSLKPYISKLDTPYYDWWIAIVATCYGKINGVPEYLVLHRMHTSNAYFKGNKISKRQERTESLMALKKFLSIEGIRPADRVFLKELIALLTANLAVTGTAIDKQLFRFAYKHRWTIFGHKKRMFPEWTLLKNAIKYSRYREA